MSTREQPEDQLAKLETGGALLELGSPEALGAEDTQLHLVSGDEELPPPPPPCFLSAPGAEKGQANKNVSLATCEEAALLLLMECIRKQLLSSAKGVSVSLLCTGSAIPSCREHHHPLLPLPPITTAVYRHLRTPHFRLPCVPFLASAPPTFSFCASHFQPVPGGRDRWWWQ